MRTENPLKKTINTIKDWFELFAEYAKHRESMGNARIATLMIDKYLQRFCEQLDILSNISNNKQEIEMGNLDKDEIKQDQGHFSMPVENYYQLSGLGFAVGGTIKSGTVHEGDEIILTNGTKAIVAYVTINRKNVAWATKDEDAELCLGYIKESDLENGTVVDGIDAETQDFEMPITEKSAVKGKGVVLKGTITKGSIKIGDAILLTDEEYRFSTHADEIDIDGNLVDSATERQSVGIHIHSMTMRSLKNNGLTVRRFSNLDNKE